MVSNKVTFTSPCADAPTLALSNCWEGRGAPVAKDGYSHRALKIHEK